MISSIFKKTAWFNNSHCYKSLRITQSNLRTMRIPNKINIHNKNYKFSNKYEMNKYNKYNLKAFA